MPKEHDHQPQPPKRRRPEEVFGFTDNERLFDRLSHPRLMAILADDATIVHKIEETYNNYGGFLFVTASRLDGDRQIFLTFWGQGFHESRERWMTDEWFWYQTHASLHNADTQIPNTQAIQQIEAHRASLPVTPAQDTQSRRGEVFEMLADLTDEDGAWVEIQDLPWWLLDEDEADGE